MKLSFLLLALIVGALNASAILPGAPSTIRELQPPREYTEKLPAYLYYKKITVTRTGDNSYLFDITLQQPMPERPPEGLGIKYIVYGDFTDQGPKGSSIPTTYSSQVVDFEKKGGSASLDTNKFDIQIEKRKYSVSVQDFKTTSSGFSFSLQSPYFAKNTPTKFQFDAASLSPPNSVARGAAPVEKHTDQAVNIDPGKPGVTIDPPLPSRVAGAPMPGFPGGPGMPPAAASPTPTPVPDPPGQVTWIPDTIRGGFGNPMMQGRLPNGAGPAGYLFFKKLVLNRESDSLKFTVTLNAPLPETFPADHGVRYSFYFQFAESEQSGLSKRKAAAAGSATSFVEIQFLPGAKQFEWGHGELRIGQQVMNLKVTDFERTADGFVATMASPVFQLDISTSVAFRAIKLLPNQALGRPGPANNSFQGPDPGDSVIVPSSADTSELPHNIGSLLRK